MSRKAELLPLLLCLSCTVLLLAGTVQSACARRGSYAQISCDRPQDLREFNDNLYLGRTLSRQVSRRNVVTVEDEVYAKIDFIVARVESVLNMFPKELRFRLVVVPTKRDIARIYKNTYHKRVNYKAYYSLSQKTVYVSAADASLRVVAHEIGHVVVDHYFKVRPPYNIHELMAQFAEKHVTD